MKDHFQDTDKRYAHSVSFNKYLHLYVGQKDKKENIPLNELLLPDLNFLLDR